MPVRHGRLIATVPTIGMQFANDCEWIVSEASQLVRDQAASLELEACLRNLAELGRQTRDEQLVRPTSWLKRDVSHRLGMNKANSPAGAEVATSIADGESGRRWRLPEHFGSCYI
jgi:hypothetical protein